MSMPRFPECDSGLTKEQALNMILSSIAMEELGLSRIISAESEKLQYVLDTLKCGCGSNTGTRELLEVNKSINTLLETALSHQMLLKSKMEHVLENYPQTCCSGGCCPGGGCPERCRPGECCQEGCCPADCCQERDCPADCCQEGRCPTDCCQERDYPVDCCQERDYPADCCQERDCPTDCCQERDCPANCCQERDCPADCCQEGRCPTDYCQEGPCPADCCPEGPCPADYCPEGPCPADCCQEGPCPADYRQEGPCPADCCPKKDRPAAECPRDGVHPTEDACPPKTYRPQVSCRVQPARDNLVLTGFYPKYCWKKGGFFPWKCCSSHGLSLGWSKDEPWVLTLPANHTCLAEFSFTVQTAGCPDDTELAFQLICEDSYLELPGCRFSLRGTQGRLATLSGRVEIPRPPDTSQPSQLAVQLAAPGLLRVEQAILSLERV